MSFGVGNIGSLLYLTNSPISLPSSQLTVMWLAIISRNSSYSFFVPPSAGAVRVFKSATSDALPLAAAVLLELVINPSELIFLNTNFLDI